MKDQNQSMNDPVLYSAHHVAGGFIAVEDLLYIDVGQDQQTTENLSSNLTFSMGSVVVLLTAATQQDRIGQV